MKIRAAVLEQFGEPLVVQELDLGDPRPGEVLVRLRACGICHTDMYSASARIPPDMSRACSATRARAWWRPSGRG